MVLLPQTGLGRLLLVSIAITSVAFLILNLVSFGGLPWITYVDLPIRFGLWTVCNTQTGACNQWLDSQFSTAIVQSTFSGTKPGKD